MELDTVLLEITNHNHTEAKSVVYDFMLDELVYHSVSLERVEYDPMLGDFVKHVHAE